jgi:hypothetical protein
MHDFDESCEIPLGSSHIATVVYADSKCSAGGLVGIARIKGFILNSDLEYFATDFAKTQLGFRNIIAKIIIEIDGKEHLAGILKTQRRFEASEGLVTGSWCSRSKMKESESVEMIGFERDDLCC